MISVDISNVWGQISLPDLLAMESEVAAAHEMLMEGTEADAEGRQWMEPRLLPEDLERMKKAAEQIRNDSDVCVVVGIGRSSLGSRAAVELLQGSSRNIGKGKGDPQLFFAGNHISSHCWNELMDLLSGKDFSIIVIAGAEITLETAIAFRSLRWMLERKYGTEAARKRIYAVADPLQGALGKMAEEEGWESFAIFAGVGDGVSVLSPAGLLPMAVAGMDIAEILKGAEEAVETYSLRSFENPVWLYAAVRNLLYRGGRAVELFESFEPGFRTFGLWWQHLFGGTEGKNGKGLFPATAELTADLCGLGQLIQKGQRNLFETMVRFAAPAVSPVIGSDWKDLDGLNYLEGQSLAFVEENAFLAAVAAHTDGGIPVMVVECGELTEAVVGELFCFLELCSGVSAYILGVNPFEQDGADLYQQKLFHLLGKPGCE